MATAVFTLTRGFRRIRDYAPLIQRNRTIKRHRKSLQPFGPVTMVIFHEGNISAFQQKLISLASGVKLVFTDVSSVFLRSDRHVWDEAAEASLGYSLMCRFNYQHVWHFLEDFSYALRVDDDCLLESLDLSAISETELVCGALSPEFHDKTNVTLPPALDPNDRPLYDHKFPYTNVFFTKTSFWLREDVQEFVHRIGEHPKSLQNRWGDLPVIGVALKKYGEWDGDASVAVGLSYRHSSHSSWVKNGQIRYDYWPAD